MAAVLDNERAGVSCCSSGRWNDATGNACPDLAQIDFNGAKTIGRVVVYTTQDNDASPVEPAEIEAWGNQSSRGKSRVPIGLRYKHLLPSVPIRPHGAFGTDRKVARPLLATRSGAHRARCFASRRET